MARESRAKLALLDVQKPTSVSALKTMPRLPLLSLLVGALVAVACGPELPRYTVVTLTTGMDVRLRQMKQGELAGGEKAVYLSYQTEVSSDDIESLRAEIQEIWLWFLRPQLEQAQIGRARIVATTSLQQGWSVSGYEFQMVYKKTPQGNWVRN